MNETHSRAIVYLLAAILCVMLFGASAFMSGMAWGAAIAAAIGLAFAALWGVARLLRHIRQEMVSERDAGRAWRYLPIFWLGLAPNFLVIACAGFIWLEKGGRFRDALVAVPYWWVPVSIMGLGMVIALAESAGDWLPAIPGRFAAFFRSWFLLFCAPVFGPIGRWREIRSARARGERVNSLGAGLSVIATFFAACLLWFGGVLLPAVLIAVLVFEGLR